MLVDCRLSVVAEKAAHQCLARVVGRARLQIRLDRRPRFVKFAQLEMQPRRLDPSLTRQPRLRTRTDLTELGDAQDRLEILERLTRRAE